MIEQHYWSIASQQILQAVTDSNCYGPTHADIEQEFRLSAFDTGITDQNYDKTQSDAKPDKRSFGQIGCILTQTRKPGFRATVVYPQENGPVEEKVQDQVNESSDNSKNSCFSE